MADVAQLPGVLEQVRLVAGLRWRILKNGLRRKNNRLGPDRDDLGWGVSAASLVIGLGFAFYAGSYEFLSKNQPALDRAVVLGIVSVVAGFPHFCGGLRREF